MRHNWEPQISWAMKSTLTQESNRCDDTEHLSEWCVFHYLCASHCFNKSVTVWEHHAHTAELQSTSCIVIHDLGSECRTQRSHYVLNSTHLYSSSIALKETLHPKILTLHTVKKLHSHLKHPHVCDVFESSHPEEKSQLLQIHWLKREFFVADPHMQSVEWKIISERLQLCLLK